jgi:hypothetical protein
VDVAARVRAATPDADHPDRPQNKEAYWELLEGRPLQPALDAICGVFYSVQQTMDGGVAPAKWTGPRSG